MLVVNPPSIMLMYTDLFDHNTHVNINMKQCTKTDDCSCLVHHPTMRNIQYTVLQSLYSEAGRDQS